MPQSGRGPGTRPAAPGLTGRPLTNIPGGRAWPANWSIGQWSIADPVVAPDCQIVIAIGLSHFTS